MSEEIEDHPLRAPLPPDLPSRSHCRLAPLELSQRPRGPSKRRSSQLSGCKTAWFLAGRGNTGKTKLARWLWGMAAQNEAAVSVAACDPGNRSLKRLMTDVAEPPSNDATETRDWLLAYLSWAVETKANVIIDLGAGQTALPEVFKIAPDLLSDGGLEPVAVYMLGTDPEDLTALALDERAGWKPRATALVLNKWFSDGDRYLHKFDEIRQHPTYLAARERGAVELWMDLLWPEAAERCRREAWHFKDVGTPSADADVIITTTVQTWLRQMSAAFEPIQSWFPR